MGAGSLLRDNPGNWLGVFSWTGRNGNPFLAESVALREGLIFAWNQGHRKLLCEVDCKELTTILASSENWRLHAQARLFKEILDLLSRNWNTRISWIKREANAPADWVTRRAYSNIVLDVTVVILPSPELEVLIRKDSLTIS